MKITKYGHSCLLVEEGSVRLLIDPGQWSQVPELEAIDAILITHNHQDHCDPSTITRLLVKNPDAKIISHVEVGEMLQREGIAYTPIEEGARMEVNGVSVESFGTKHAIIYGDFPQCRNTGYLIAGRLYLPGDALHDVPGKSVEILGLPTGGPWMRLSEAIDYAKKLSPKVAFPIHDAMYTTEYKEGLIPRIVGGQLEVAGISFNNFGAGNSADF